MARILLKKVIRVGHSFYICFNKDMLGHLKIMIGDYVSIRLTKDKIEIKKLQERNI